MTNSYKNIYNPVTLNVSSDRDKHAIGKSEDRETVALLL